jgi:CHAT domain-containing protein
LWEVDDEATAELMMEFYRLLHTQPDMDTLEALRQAQIHVMKLTRDGVQPFADPSYWAAFQLIGDYR